MIGAERDKTPKNGLGPGSGVAYTWSLWSRVMWRLESDLPSSWASSCPTPPDLEDAFDIMKESWWKMREETICRWSRRREETP
jgi:hypothetical protein